MSLESRQIVDRTTALRQDAFQTMLAYTGHWGVLERESVGLSTLRNILSNDGSCVDRKNLNGHLTSSVLVMDESGRVLVIRHKHLQAWLPPGGHVERDSVSLLDSAWREVEEETGVPVSQLEQLPTLGAVPLAILRYDIPARATRQEQPHHHADFLYVARVRQPVTLSAQLEEVETARWMALDEFERLSPAHFTHVLAKLRKALA